MIYHFILNPKSGRPKRHQNLEEVIKNACAKRRLSYHIYYTVDPNDATEYVASMVRISEEKQRFICVGGDGTLNEIVNGAPCNPNVEFGTIPYGSGNDFVKNFTNTNLFSDIEKQIDGESIPIDIIKCNDIYCVNMINIGLDCMVAKYANDFKKKKLVTPKLSYKLGVIKAFFKKFNTKMRVIFDDGTIWDESLTLTCIGNGKFCGGGYKSCPTAVLNDGIMDVTSIKEISRLNFLKLITPYKKGTYINNKTAKKYILTKRVNHFKMEFDNPLPYCIDGEIKGALNIDFSVVKEGLHFVVPKGSKLITNS